MTCPKDVTLPHHTPPTYIIRNSLKRSPLWTHTMPSICMIYAPHILHASLRPHMHYTHRSHITHTCLHAHPSGRLWGFCIVNVLLRERCFILATEATSPTKMHKDFSKECSLLLTSITCLINSQAWFEDLTWGLISIQGKINGELRGLMCRVSGI